MVRVTNVLLRGFRSFNFDYRKKHQTPKESFQTTAAPWESVSTFDDWKPWVNVPISVPIATVVGANESGKSFLLEALIAFRSTQPLDISAICRYSEDFNLYMMSDIEYPNIEPRIGIVLSEITQSLLATLNAQVPDSDAHTELTQEAKEITDEPSANTEATPSEETSNSEELSENDKVPLRPLAVTEVEKVAIVRNNHASYSGYIYRKDDAEIIRIEIEGEQIKELLRSLPNVAEVDPFAELPSSIKVTEFLKIAYTRRSKQDIQAFIQGPGKKFFDSPEHFDKMVVDDDKRLLARLLEVSAKLEPSALLRVIAAPVPARSALSVQASERAEEFLNLSFWWGQDVDARIHINILDDRIDFQLSDRTRSSYGFDERSTGMKRFLAYLLQVLLHIRSSRGPLIILSDEPDYALSAVGQRDLLRFFRKIATADDSRDRCQMIYTTHSPELIDVNYPARITILRKGLFEDGTIAIDKAHHRIFEPVRSALGTQMTCLPFLDAPNVVLEGTSDAVFITRMSQYLANRGLQFLDLSYVSFIIAQGGKQLARIIRMANSLPGDKAYLTILLDSDASGIAAANEAVVLDSSLKSNKQIVMIADILGSGLGFEAEIEDLIPPDIYLEAYMGYVSKMKIEMDTTIYASTVTQLLEKQHISNLDRLESLRETLSHTEPLDKDLLIDLSFDIFERGNNIGEDNIFFKQLRKLTDLLKTRVDENVERRRRKDVQRALRFMTDEFFVTNRDNIDKIRTREFLERLAQVAEIIDHDGAFAKRIVELRKKHEVDNGLPSDPVSDREELHTGIYELLNSLSVDVDVRAGVPDKSRKQKPVS